MRRKQISKILVFLLMLGILYGCKRHLLDPLNPQTQLPQKVQFDKVKGFYDNGRYKNQPKSVSSGNERMTAADSARFKDFEPQWDKTEVELLPNNEKMLIVPVVRNLQVDYNENIGFIRRLCIRVDANEDFIEANIVELVGNLTFVKENHNDIFKNYKENNISGFSGKIIGYQLDYDKVSYTDFDNGTGTNTSGDLTFYDDGNGCFSIFSDDGSLIFKICDGGNNGDTGSGSSGSGSGGSGGIGSPSSSPNPFTPYTHVPFTPRAPSGPGYTQGPTGTPNNTGTIGGGGGNGQYNPPLVFIPFVSPPPPPMPHPGMIWISDLGWIDPPTTVDNGVSWAGEGNGGAPQGPFISGKTYKNVKSYATNSLPLVVNALATMTLTPEQRTYLGARRDGLTALLAIMEKIETNTKDVWLDVEVDNTYVESASTGYDIAVGWVKIKISPPPVFPPPNATDAQLNAYEDAMQAYTALLAHELKHVEQFIDGKISFNATTGERGVLHDIQDEKESFDLQFLIMGNPLPRTNAYIRGLLYNGIPVYGIDVLDGPLQVGSPNVVLTNDIYIQP